MSSEKYAESFITSEVTHDEAFDECRDLADAVQQKLGISSPTTEFLITNNSVERHLEQFTSDSPSRRFSIINFPEGSDTIGRVHEIAHAVVKGSLDSIRDESVRGTLEEGICDLAAYEVLYDQNPESFFHQFKRAAEEYTELEFSEEYKDMHDADDLFLTPFSGKQYSVGHAIGRKFAFSIRMKYPELKVSDFVDCVAEHPPTWEQMLEPEAYFDVVEEFEPVEKEIIPKQTYFREMPQRLI